MTTGKRHGLRNKVIAVVLVLFAALFFVPVTAFAEGPTEITVSNYDELADAARTIKAAPGDYTVRLTNDIAIRGIRFEGSGNVTIEGDGHSLYYADDVSGSQAVALMTAAGGVNLTLSGVTVDGKEVATNMPMVNVTGGSTLNINDGTILQNGSSYAHCGGVWLERGSTVNMNGGTISNCKYVANNGSYWYYYPGGVYVGVGTTFNMYGGTITGCTGSFGGGVGTLWSDYGGAGTINIQGGSLTGNMARYFGGAVCSWASSSATINNAEITGNSAGYFGGGVATFWSNMKMADVSVSGNSAKYAGGGVYLPGTYSGSAITNTFVLSGAPLIEGNSTEAAGGDDNLYLGEPDQSPHFVFDCGGLTDGARVGITECDPTTTAAYTNGYTANNPGVHPSAYFTSDDPEYIIDYINNDTEARLAKFKTITFKVVNGTWADGSADDLAVQIPLWEDAGTLPADKAPNAMVPDQGFADGAWDTEPNTTEGGITDDVTYTYTFTPAKYTVTYNPNGAEGSVTDPNSYEAGSTVTVLSDKDGEGITRDGYTFRGWAASQENADAGTVDYAPGSTFAISADTELFAVWEEDVQPVEIPDGTLTVSNKVTNGGDANKEFRYTFTFSGDGAYSYSGSKSGTVKSGDPITLKSGESITITLKEGMTYKAVQTEETDYTADPGTLTFEGTIEGDKDSKAAYTNEYKGKKPSDTGKKDKGSTDKGTKKSAAKKAIYSNPVTGDQTMIKFWGFLTGIAIVVLVCILIVGKKKKK